MSKEPKISLGVIIKDPPPKAAKEISKAPVPPPKPIPPQNQKKI